jgi:hypothetical protein
LTGGYRRSVPPVCPATLFLQQFLELPEVGGHGLSDTWHGNAPQQAARTVELKLHPVGEPGSLSGGVQGIEQAGPEGPPQDHRDRRFNRRKYDATKTVEAFSTCLRDELYLDTLSAEPCGRSNDTTHHRVAWLRPSVSSSTNGDQAI